MELSQLNNDCAFLEYLENIQVMYDNFEYFTKYSKFFLVHVRMNQMLSSFTYYFIIYSVTFSM